MSIALFAFHRVVGTAAAFLTVKVLTSYPVRSASAKVYRKLTGQAGNPSPRYIPEDDFDPETGEFRVNVRHGD